MNFNFFKSKTVLIVIISVIFGFAAGMVGELIARVYLFENLLNIPLYGEIDLTNGIHGNTNLIIRDAKKVVVEQDEKIEESIEYIKSNIVGIFKKSGQDQSSSLYYSKDEVAQGIILTSDGWIISDLDNTQINDKFFDNFFIATDDGQVYDIDKILNDKFSSYSFLHVKDVRDLPVTQFISINEINQGGMVIIFDWDQNSLISTISGKVNQKIFSSDIVSDEFLLSTDVSNNKSSFVYSLSGKFLGFVSNDNSIFPVYNLERIINAVLRDGELKRIKMGLSYIDFSDFISRDSEMEGVQIVKNINNISIEKNSPAFMAGLKESDIIFSIDNIELNDVSKLNVLIQKYKKGDSINISYLRNGEKNNTNLILDEY